MGILQSDLATHANVRMGCAFFQRLRQMVVLQPGESNHLEAEVRFLVRIGYDPPLGIALMAECVGIDKFVIRHPTHPFTEPLLPPGGIPKCQ